MPQNRESGIAANQYGRATARKIMESLGARTIKSNGNECYLNNKLIAIKCARKRTSDFGLSYKMLERIDGVIGACEIEQDTYKLYELSTQLFRKNMRPTKSKGPAAGRVGLVRKSVFYQNGKLIGHINVNPNKAGKKLPESKIDLSKNMKLDSKKDLIKRIGDEVLSHARFVIGVAAGDDIQMKFKLNRWVYSRLMQEEIREKRPIKQALWNSGVKACQKCGQKFKDMKGIEIHRKDSEKIYSVENCELLCRPCHQQHPSE